jgi:hypothetical protein
LTFFVDANVVAYSRLPSPYRAACLEILARGEADERTSTAALEEVLHLELSGRAGDRSSLLSTPESPRSRQGTGTGP